MVAATDFSNEMSLSQEILKRMTDSYRRMRNTVRFLLGNLHGFEPSQALPAEQLLTVEGRKCVQVLGCGERGRCAQQTWDERQRRGDRLAQ